MASAEFIEEALNNNVDESAVNAIVGSLETQLVTSSADNKSFSNGNFANIQNQGDMSGASIGSDGNTQNFQAISSNSQVNQLQLGRSFVNQGNLTQVIKTQEPAKLIYPQTSQTLGQAVSMNNRVIYPNQSMPNRTIALTSFSQNVIQTASPGNIVSQAVGKPVQIQSPLIIKQGNSVNQVGIRPNLVSVQGANASMPMEMNKGMNQNIVTTQAPIIGGGPHGNLPSNVQIVNMRPGAPVAGQKNIATVSPRVVLGSPQMMATRPPGPGITLQTLQGFQPGQQGHLLLKTENGQFQLLRVGPPTNPTVGNVHQGQSLRLATVSAPGVAVASSSGMTMVAGTNLPSSPSTMQPAQVAVVNSTMPQVTQTQLSNAQNIQSRPVSVTQSVPAANPLTQKTSIDNMKEKCRKFLSNLLDLSSKEPKAVERNVRILIQELIDMRVEPEAFCARLERLLNASPQPCLIGFLKKTLPILRQSLLNKELVIDGIHPPPANTVFPNSNASQPPTIIHSSTVQQSGMSTLPPLQASMRPTTSPQTTPGAISKTSTPLRNVTKPSFQNLPKTFIKLANTVPSTSQGGINKPFMKDKDKKSMSFSQPSYDIDKMAGDDDINDVAAMGGVNLAEESQKILGSTEMIGTQIRSCKDEYLASMGPLQARLKQICAKHGLDEPGFDVAALISHAVQERLKNLVEKLSCISEHRMDVIKLYSDYIVTQDIKGQLKFLEDLDRVERKRREDYEREILLRAAKSRSKSEDPEQVKLKEKAKEMQRAEMEEMRQREANLTALQAIGPRKKPRLGLGTNDSPSSLEANTVETMLGVKNGVNRSTAPLRARMKRVNFRDLLFLLEQEKETCRSNFLYKCYLK